MGVLADIDTTLKNSDISLIKKTLFDKLCRFNRDACFTFTVYELVRCLDIELADIEMLLENGVCKEHASVIEYQLDKAIPHAVSDFNFCKAYLNNSGGSYKLHGIHGQLSYSTQDFLDKSALGCLIIFDPQTQKEFFKYKYEYKTTNIDDDGFLKYSFPTASIGYGYSKYIL